MVLSKETFIIEDSKGLTKKHFLIGIIGLLLCIPAYFMDSQQFFHSYLVAFAFWVTLGLGGLFFVLMHHLTGAEWSVVLRRIAEAVMVSMPILALFFIPIALFGIHDLYHWSHHDAVAHDVLLQKKSAYLNETFFLLRTFGYFLIWFLIARTLRNQSLSASCEGCNVKMRRTSAIGTLLFALTVSFASFDWLMSLEAHWFSTMFGVYIFGGSYLTMICFTILVGLYLRNRSILDKEFSIKHYHDLGRIAFGFTVFWAYIAGSQYFLIWYTNIPEETMWFLERWNGSWKTLSLVIIAGHFIAPFLILLFHNAKRNLSVIGGMAGLLICMHWLDMYWNVMPGYLHHGVHFSWMDITTMLGIGGIFMAFFWKNYLGSPILPLKDPRLKHSLK